MELDEIRGRFFRRLGGGSLCFCVFYWVWIQDVDEKVSMFDADHDLYVIVVKSL